MWSLDCPRLLCAPGFVLCPICHIVIGDYRSRLGGSDYIGVDLGAAIIGVDLRAAGARGHAWFLDTADVCSFCTNFLIGLNWVLPPSTSRIIFSSLYLQLRIDHAVLSADRLTLSS